MSVDNKSQDLLRGQPSIEHVERKQKVVDKKDVHDLPPEPPKEEDQLLEEDQYKKIYEKSQQVQELAKVVEQQVAKKLKDYKVAPSQASNELLDAEERLFGTRTGVITYQMYRVCLEIVGNQAQEFAGKVAVNPDKILSAVGGNLENAFKPEGISNFLKTNDLMKNGRMDFSKYAPINMPEMDSVMEEGIKKLWDMIVDIALPKPLKALI